MKYFKYIVMVFAALIMTGCLTMSGIYSVKAYDNEGVELSKNLNMIAQGSSIYSVRNALCAQHPGAKIIIIDQATKQELKSESPYQCR